MKKMVAWMLSLTMAATLVACGNGNANENANANSTNSNTPAVGENTGMGSEFISDPDQISDTANSPNGKYEVGFVADVGALKDKSFNEGTFDGVKLYAYNNGLTYKYYMPSGGHEATDEDRYNAMKAAVEGGAKVVVCAGYLQEAAVNRAAIEFSDVRFIFIDGYPLSDEDGNLLTNIAAIGFREEQSGYLAGYAAVMEGFTNLGFSGGGGGTNPAVGRFGHGFAQGVNAAAAELGKQVNMNYSYAYGASFSASTDLQTMANGWYTTGTEVIFACGGPMFNSIVAAASANDGYVIGVDIDQSYDSDTVITSATKGLADAVQWALDKVYSDTFEEIGGVSTTLGVEEDAVALPVDTWKMENFTISEYEMLFEKLVSGEIEVDGDYENNLQQDYSNLTIKFN